MEGTAVQSKAIFATTNDGKWQLAVLMPSFLEEMFGQDWYKQSIFLKRPYPFMGEGPSPKNIWKGSGIVDFRNNYPPQGHLLDKNKPNVMWLFSLEKRQVFKLEIDFNKHEVQIVDSYHTEPSHRMITKGGDLLNGFGKRIESKNKK